MIGTTRPHYRILENAGRRPLDSREETEMALASGAQVGRYRIVAALGAGPSTLARRGR